MNDVRGARELMLALDRESFELKFIDAIEIIGSTPME